MANWLDVLLSYDFDIHHRPGSSMVLPDSLSRMYQFVPRARTCLDLKSTEEKQAEPVSVRRITVDELTKYPDRELAQLINDRLLKKHVAEREQQLKIVRSTHARGHFGAEKIYNLIGTTDITGRV